MARICCQIVILFALIFQAVADPSLEFFTNEANVKLEAQFGFGLTNIPVYCPTNPAIRYIGNLHYLLQSAANDYDAKTPGTNFPSVFRPLFSWKGGTLYIVGYAAVTNDFYSQTSLGFKDLSDARITTNENVWGIPWVVGAKGQVPAFNGYGCSSEVIVWRDVLFQRWTGPSGLPDTNRPPQFTNQMFCLAISNILGAQAWNFYNTPFTNSVTIVVSNRISLTLTNNYGWGSKIVLNTGTNLVVNSWQAWNGLLQAQATNSMIVPQIISTIDLPASYWSESTKQFIPLSSLTNSLPLPEDLTQTGWPVHAWIFNVTNDLMYSLIDNESGRVLDYVSLGNFGSSMSITNLLLSIPTPGIMPWAIGQATDQPDSPMSDGLLTQIFEDESADQLYFNALNGINPSPSGAIFQTPFNPTNKFVNMQIWQVINPLAHFTIDNLSSTNPVDAIAGPGVGFPIPLTNPVTSGSVNRYYERAFMNSFESTVNDQTFQIQFNGVTDVPYAVWASTDLINWDEVGTADQPAPGSFRFADTATNSSARFYEVRLP